MFSPTDPNYTGVFKVYDGTKRYYLDGELHRDGDLPAIEFSDGCKEYYKNGKIHRDGDLPAIVHPSGQKLYYKYGVLHRDGDLPAATLYDRSLYYYKNGALHRDGDLPALEHADGGRHYYKNGELHRDSGEPAMEYLDATKTQRYFLYGTEISETIAKLIAKRERAILKNAFRYWYDWTYFDPNSNAFKARLARDMAEYEEITGGFGENTPPLKRARTH